jgi:hypothetical protein
LATRIASFDKWAIVNTKRLVKPPAYRRTSRSLLVGRLYDLDRSTGCAGQDQGFV